MAILKVAKLGHPVLRRVADKVPHELIGTPEFQQLIDNMIETMAEYGGVGLAAPQVHHSWQLLITEDIPDPDAEDDETGGDGFLVRKSVIINPEITFLTDEEIAYFEGCLSVPDFRGRVPRISRIRLRALDREGKTIDREIAGFPAVVFQHEIDHLNGIVFLDRMRDLQTLTYLKEFERYWVAPEVPVAD